MDSEGSLPEEKFIQEGYRKNPYPAWSGVLFLLLFVVLAWGGGSWYVRKMQEEVEASPFLQVTNREFSLFLWQNPEFMKGNAPYKTGYLPGFGSKSQPGVIPEEAEEFVVAPPEVLFRYHTWKRLVSSSFFSRPIPLVQFRKFLQEAEEWSPAFWSAAPRGYVEFVNRIDTMTLVDLEDLPFTTLPRIVRAAFQGWKNFYQEGEQIDRLEPSLREVGEFLSLYPHFARNYWINLVKEERPNYLLEREDSSSRPLPPEQMTPFLRVALYNFLQTHQRSTIQKPSS